MRYLGLDYGAKTVGVAVSDPLLMGATPVEIIRRDRESKLRKTFVRIEELIAEYDVDEIVLGLPLNMDGSEGERAIKTKEFGAALSKRCGLKVHYFDERLSSIEAHELLEEHGIKSIDHDEFIDKMAAMVILQGFLDSVNES
ncbi:MAG: Holliday junction resolvase RuvX [Lachnospiraceae bacterium]|nr:Holliday junction resolvase RuvX [Lachnospiraceae bacterium]